MMDDGGAEEMASDDDSVNVGADEEVIREDAVQRFTTHSGSFSSLFFWNWLFFVLFERRKKKILNE
jgi:hypothetical protein